VSTSISVTGADRFGNPVLQTSLAASLSVTALPSGPAVQLTDTSAGAATLLFQASALGTYQVAVTLAGAHLRGSPINFQVVDHLTAAPSNTLVWGSFVTGAGAATSGRVLTTVECRASHRLPAGKPRAGEKSDVYVQLRDASGNRIFSPSSHSLALACNPDPGTPSRSPPLTFCEPRYPLLVSWQQGVWHFKVKVRCLLGVPARHSSP